MTVVRAAIVGTAVASLLALTPARLERVVYRGSGPARTTVVSPIRPIERPTGPGPWLGRPRVDPSAAAAFAVPKVTNPEQIEREIGAAVNALRQSRGLRPLRVSPPLERAGDAHARALALVGAFTHDWPATRAPFARWIVRYYGVTSRRRWSAGENLLWAEGGVTPENAVAMWLASPPHRRIMLKRYWRELGIGAVHAEGAGGVFGGRTVVVVAAEFGVR